MTTARGVGGSTPEQALARLHTMCNDMGPLPIDEFAGRIQRAQALMQSQGLAALYLNAGTNLYYFTGTQWWPSERMVGVLLPAQGAPHYIGPMFEQNTLNDYMQVRGEFHGWHEHESPYELFGELLRSLGIHEGLIGLDESAPFFLTNGLARACPGYQWINGDVVTAGCRMHKSAQEIALLQRAKDMTMAVHRAAASILRPGISTLEVADFIDRAHKKVGAAGSSFCIVLFGVASSFPHGVKDPQTLQDNDWVLIDTGCKLHGYNSDITRSYPFGDITVRQRQAFAAEQEAQAAALAAAQLGQPCGAPDDAARRVLAAHGFDPDYGLPGLPHRTGHGCGLDIHEWPYLVRGNSQPLATGMVFSNEPMLVLPGEFGVRLEDHFYMTDNGPRWFTQPSESIENPLNL